MRMVVVIRQLSALLDELLVRETYKFGLTPEDALLMAWMVEQPGIGCARLGERVGRQRSSVQRTLKRLKKRGLVEPWDSSFTKRTAGWSLTERGQELWDQVSRSFDCQDRELEGKGANLRQWRNSLEELMGAIYGVTRTRTWGEPMVIPPQEQKIPDWDY